MIDTTRPELLISCVALVAHPSDERYQPMFGSTVTTPIFGVEVPVVAHELAEPDKGTGIAMICTFGDTTDVTWWRELNLPSRAVIGRDGRFAAETPHWIDSDAGREAVREHRPQGRRRRRDADRRDAARIRRAARRIRPIQHQVKFFEQGRPATRDRHRPGSGTSATVAASKSSATL